MKNKFKFWDFDKKVYVESNEVLQMSATDISAGKDCEYKLFYKYQKIFKPVKNIYLIIGSIFHTVVEQDLRHKVNTRENQKWSYLKDYFENEWKRQTKNIQDYGKYSELQAKNMCLNYIQNYIIKMSPMLYPFDQESIEKFFRVFINYQGKRLGLTGKVDMIGKDLFVIDHKTASSSWSQDKAENELQAQIYPFCLKNIGYDIRGFRFNVVCKDNVIPYQVEYDTSKVGKILEDAFAIKDRIENDVMLRAKSSQTCKWCEYASVCK